MSNRTDSLKALVLASFLGDALAMPAHWLYEPGEVEQRFGRINGLMDPPRGCIHHSKRKGEFTHYGDQMLTLLESVAASNGFDSADFWTRRLQLFGDDYEGYRDAAIKETLRLARAGKGPAEAGSPAPDFAAAARIAPIVYRYADDQAALLTAAKNQAQTTHQSPTVAATAAFLARLTLAALDGLPLTEAIAAGNVELQQQPQLTAAVENGLMSVGANSAFAISALGQTGDCEAALAGVIHLIVKHPGNLTDALCSNVMAGGDSAARGLAVGLILGAKLGTDAIPADWLAELAGRDRILALLALCAKSCGPD